jgi:hypothetical protein
MKELSDTLKTIPKGTLILVTEGEYSSYSVDGLYRAEKDIDIPGLLKEYLLVHPEQEKDYAFSADGFLAYLYVRDPALLEEISFAELHLSDSHLEEVFLQIGRQDA